MCCTVPMLAHPCMFKFELSRKCKILKLWWVNRSLYSNASGRSSVVPILIAHNKDASAPQIHDWYLTGISIKSIKAGQRTILKCDIRTPNISARRFLRASVVWYHWHLYIFSCFMFFMFSHLGGAYGRRVCISSNKLYAYDVFCIDHIHLFFVSCSRYHQQSQNRYVVRYVRWFFCDRTLVKHLRLFRHMIR